MSDLVRLLAIQEQDTVIDRIAHKRDALPARSALAAELTEAADLKAKLASALAKRDEVASAQAKLDAEVTSLDQRIKTINARLYGSEPVSSKDAQAMTEEVRHLQAQKSQLEDSELELMEALEPEQAQVDRLESQARELGGRLAATKHELAQAEGEIEAELETEKAKRAGLAPMVDPSLLRKYEELRPKLGGVAVARLEGERCGGCHLTLSAAERMRINGAKSGELVFCEECGRIIVGKRD